MCARRWPGRRRPSAPPRWRPSPRPRCRSRSRGRSAFVPSSKPWSRSSRAPLRGGGRPCLDGHEVGQAGDLEDLPVVVGKAARCHGHVGASGPAQEPDDERDAGRVDVGHRREIERERRRTRGRCLAVGPVEGRAGLAVDVAREQERRLAAVSRPPSPQARSSSRSPSRCITSEVVWCVSSPATASSSTMFRIRKSPHPRGVCSPASFASRSGSGASATGRAPPWSVTSTRSEPAVADDADLDGKLCAELVSVLHRVHDRLGYRRLHPLEPAGGRPAAASAGSSRRIASRSLPGSLGIEIAVGAARRRRARSRPE